MILTPFNHADKVVEVDGFLKKLTKRASRWSSKLLKDQEFLDTKALVGRKSPSKMLLKPLGNKSW